MHCNWSCDNHMMITWPRVELNSLSTILEQESQKQKWLESTDCSYWLVSTGCKIVENPPYSILFLAVREEHSGAHSVPHVEFPRISRFNESMRVIILCRQHCWSTYIADYCIPLAIMTENHNFWVYWIKNFALHLFLLASKVRGYISWD